MVTWMASTVCTFSSIAWHTLTNVGRLLHEFAQDSLWLPLCWCGNNPLTDDMYCGYTPPYMALSNYSENVIKLSLFQSCDMLSETRLINWSQFIAVLIPRSKHNGYWLLLPIFASISSLLHFSQSRPGDLSSRLPGLLLLCIATVFLAHGLKLHIWTIRLKWSGLYQRYFAYPISWENLPLNSD